MVVLTVSMRYTNTSGFFVLQLRSNSLSLDPKIFQRSFECAFLNSQALRENFALH